MRRAGVAVLCWHLLACAQEEACEGYQPLQGLERSEVADALEYRRALAEGGFEIVGSVGTPCEQATDRVHCLETFAAASIAGGLRESGLESLRGRACLLYPDTPLIPPAGGAEFIVVTRGDEVHTVSTWPELQALIGPVDSYAKATLYAYVQGYEILCPEGTSAYTCGWAVSTRIACGDARGKVRVRVQCDGKATPWRYVEDVDPER